jgi:hypothetical protein
MLCYLQADRKGSGPCASIVVAERRTRGTARPDTTL